jgi:hypothetical protein
MGLQPVMELRRFRIELVVNMISKINRDGRIAQWEYGKRSWQVKYRINGEATNYCFLTKWPTACS